MDPIRKIVTDSSPITIDRLIPSRPQFRPPSALSNLSIGFGCRGPCQRSTGTRISGEIHYPKSKVDRALALEGHHLLNQTVLTVKGPSHEFSAYQSVDSLPTIASTSCIETVSARLHGSLNALVSDAHRSDSCLRTNARSRPPQTPEYAWPVDPGTNDRG